MLSNTGINKIILLGQISKVPRMHTFNNQQKFLCFTLVTVETIKKGLENIEHQEFHNIKIPEKVVMQDSLDLETGQTIYIEGKIQTTAFVDEQRIKRYNLEIVANKIEVLTRVLVEV
jgi:single-strand DNA-binding protein